MIAIIKIPGGWSVAFFNPFYGRWTYAHLTTEDQLNTLLGMIPPTFIRESYPLSGKIGGDKPEP